MNEELSRLYQKVCDYSPDDRDTALTFTQRLARENGWHLRYAQRVVEEYKRFMFLAVAAGHPVTPSEQVDQAWHLHLIYSRSYWDDFCGQVLGTPVHHGPTKGGADEQDKFLNLYDQTKASYERLLNESPPPDIWPDAARRFGHDVDCVRVNTGEHWVIPKRRARRFAMLAVATLILVATAISMLSGGVSLQAERSIVRIGNSALPPNASSNALVRSAIWNGPSNNNPHAMRIQAVSQRAAPPNRTRDYGLVFVLVVGMIVFLIAIFAVFFNGKCSACGRARAMKKTGNTQHGSGWFTPDKDEWKCIYCGAALWATHCGGGCGGTSGCGGTTHCGGGDAGCAASGCGGSGCGGGGCGGGGCGGN